MIKAYVRSIAQKVMKDQMDESLADLKRNMRDHVRLECAEIVKELFMDPRDTAHILRGYSVEEVDTIQGTMKKAMLVAASKEFTERHKAETERLVSSEAFIDQVVDRINRKRVKG